MDLAERKREKDRDLPDSLQEQYDQLGIELVRQKALLIKAEEEIRRKDKKIQELYTLLSAKEEVIISLRETRES